jgi:hypothetical protein
MSHKKLIFLGLLLLGLALVLAACTAPTVEATPCPDCPPPEPCPTVAVPTCPECPPTPVCPEVVVADVPFEEAWVASGHAAADTEPFRHWDEEDPREVPTSCAKCHSGQGFMDFIAADGSEFGTVDAAVPVDPENPMGTVISCATCHNDAASALSSVVFPSGAEITGLGGEARCMQCHQAAHSSFG